MKRFLSSFITVFMLAVYAVPAAFAENTLNVSFDSNTKVVSIQGHFESGANKQVTVLVTKPSGEVDYLNQSASDSSGNFSFSYKLTNAQSGNYKVSVGGDGISTPLTRTFTSIVPGDGNPSTTPTPTPTPTPKPDHTIEIKLGSDAVKITVENKNGNVTAVVEVDGTKLKQAIQSAIDSDKGALPVIRIEIKGSEPAKQISIPASVFKDITQTNPNVTIIVQSENASYRLPVKVINVDALAKLLGTDAQNVKLNIHMQKVSPTTAQQLNNNAKSVGANLLGEPLDFKVTADANGKSVEINNFGTTYVSRTLDLPKSIDPNRGTGIFFDPTTGLMYFAPSVFVNADGKQQAVIKRNANSIYSVIENSKSFSDIGTHWAKGDIELLASKLVLQGMTETSYAPESVITRAQFAALLTRALGLSDDASGAKFKDVASSDWFAGSVGASVKAGLVAGYEDGSFKPNDKITREQMAVMAARAVGAAGKTVAASGVPSFFKDKNAVSSWAQASVGEAVQAGIIQGMTDTTFAPADNASRAQAAVMLKRMLQYVEFIN